MADGPVAAELARIRKTCADADRLEAAGNMDGALLLSAVLAGKVPRLLAALEAVLKHHQRVPLFGSASTQGKPDACPHDPDRDWDCHFEDPDSGEWLCEETTAGAACSCTELPDGERIPWPCDEVAAILAALTGKEPA